jgi:FG-GAP-like repeat
MATPMFLKRVMARCQFCWGNGDGTFQAAKTTTSSALALVQAVGDLNGDQKLDLFVSTSSNQEQFATMFGNGDGTFQVPGNQFSPNLVNSPTLADINDDGKLDLLVQGGPPFLQVYLGNGDGTFSVGQSYPYNSVDLFSSNILVGDFTDDHKLDITSAQSILFGNVDGTFRSSPAILLPDGSYISAAVSGDFNGDGKTDMAVASRDGNLYIYLTDATGGHFC